jgi:hypothetical protein
MFKMTLAMTVMMSLSTSFACYKVADNSSDGYACGKVDSSGDVFVKKSDSSDDGYKWVYSGKDNSSSNDYSYSHHSSYGSNYNGHFGHSGISSNSDYFFGHNYNNVPDLGNTYSGSVSSSCSPDLMENNVVKTDKLAKSLVADQKFASEVAFTNTLKSILEIKSDEAKLKAYFSLVNVQNAQDIAFFVGARDDEFDRYEANLVANTELDPALAKIVVAKMIKNLRGN